VAVGRWQFASGSKKALWNLVCTLCASVVKKIKVESWQWAVGCGHYAVGGKQLTVADRLSDLREKKQQVAVCSWQVAVCKWQ